MNKSKMLLVGVLLASASLCGAQKINPITQAVLDSYEEVLRENPEDYFTLFQRGAQYYNLSMYERAILDLEEAIKYTPSKDKDMLGNEYSLLADAYIEKGDYNKAKEAIKKALEVAPSSYPNTYKLGNICLYLNEPEEAYTAFKALQRMQSRSQEAFFGMAKADIMMGNNKEAEEFMKEAERVDPTNYITYCRIGDLYKDLGQNEKAVTNYLVAYSMADNPGRPIASIVEVSNTDMPAVMSALDYTISRSDNNSTLKYLKANLALNGGDYKTAENIFKELSQLEEMQNESVIYRSLAEIQKALNNQTEAIANIDEAIKIDDSIENRLIKADVMLASNPAEALDIAESILKSDESNEGALMTAAKAAAMSGNGEKALKHLNTAVMLNPANIEALTLRGFVNAELMNDEKLAVLDFTRAASGTADQYPALFYLAYAKAKSGKNLDAEAMVSDALKAPNADKDTFYYAALYYNQTGNKEKATENLKKAKEAGYQNEYNLSANNEPLRSLK